MGVDRTWYFLGVHESDESGELWDPKSWGMPRYPKISTNLMSLIGPFRGFKIRSICAYALHHERCLHWFMSPSSDTSPHLLRRYQVGRISNTPPQLKPRVRRQSCLNSAIGGQWFVSTSCSMVCLYQFLNLPLDFIFQVFSSHVQQTTLLQLFCDVHKSNLVDEGLELSTLQGLS